MLKFYYNPISVNARRVWAALLEKQIPFEPILVNLDGDQFHDDFTAINPLQRIPAIVDDGLWVVESLAILDFGGGATVSAAAYLGRYPSSFQSGSLLHSLPLVEQIHRDLQTGFHPIKRSGQGANFILRFLLKVSIHLSHTDRFRCAGHLT